MSPADSKTTLSLQGLRIIWTGTKGSANKLLKAATNAGASVASHPLIQFGPPSDEDEVDAALKKMDDYAWILFTSKEAVRRATRHHPKPKGKIGAVGPGCAELLKSNGWEVHKVGEVHTAAGLADALAKHQKPQKPVLFIKGQKAQPTLPQRLAKKGWTVEELEIYTTTPVSTQMAKKVIEHLKTKAEVVVMGSPMGVNTLKNANNNTPLKAINPNLIWIALGPTTQKALQNAGCPSPLVLSQVHPVEFVDLLVRNRTAV